MIDDLLYRADGRGYLEPSHRHVFVLPADGGTPRQLTTGDFDHAGPIAWSPNGETLVVSANRHEDWQQQPQNSELYELSIADGTVRVLTDRVGPDAAPTFSPDGRWIAWTGYDDRFQGYQVENLYVMRRDGSQRRALTAELDRAVASPTWSADGKRLFFSYSDHGIGKVGAVDLEGRTSVIAEHLGGTSLGRPYASGSFSVGGKGSGEIVAFTVTSTERPADIAVTAGVGAGSGKTTLLTALNDDLLAQRCLAPVEELRVESSRDGRSIQAWLARSPDCASTGDVDSAERLRPLILEIHGGPFADYGWRWSTEVQLYAAAGYDVLYVNPRGSSGYGEEFGNLIHHAYPGDDYDDLMSAVDAAIASGGIDADQLFVTGGSGGGVLTAWIVGKTDRFRAAVSAKPVINWFSFALTADAYNFFYRYWFPGLPWDHPQHYFERSPISLVGKVTTPTMLLTGEQDYRTPISETEQFYQALKLRQVDTQMVRIPEASHGIAARPSHLIAKVAHILAWFERYR